MQTLVDEFQIIYDCPSVFRERGRCQNPFASPSLNCHVMHSKLFGKLPVASYCCPFHNHPNMLCLLAYVMNSPRV